MSLVLLFDTETSGLVRNSLVPLERQPAPIEFFGHIVDDASGEILEELEFFANPGFTIDPVITQITGIKPEQLVNEKPFRHYVPQVKTLIEKSDLVVAHNLSFDKAIIDFACKRCGVEVNWPRLCCSVQETEWIKSHRLKLTDLHEELFGEPFVGAHRARVDVEALTRCYLELRRRGDL